MKALKYALLWRKLRTILTNALELERNRIGSEQAGFVADYLCHNEFGLAHSQLIDALSDLDLTPLEATQQLLKEALSLMNSAE